MSIEESAKIVNCNFAFKCTQKWEDMTATRDEEVRFCRSCQKDVYFAKNDEVLRDLIGENRCVAVLQNSTQINNNFSRPDFSQVTAGIPVMPEHFREKETLQEIRSQSSPKKVNNILVIISVIVGAIIGISIGTILGLFIARTVFEWLKTR